MRNQLRCSLLRNSGHGKRGREHIGYSQHFSFYLSSPSSPSPSPSSPFPSSPATSSVSCSPFPCSPFSISFYSPSSSLSFFTRHVTKSTNVNNVSEKKDHTIQRNGEAVKKKRHRRPRGYLYREMKRRKKEEEEEKEKRNRDQLALGERVERNKMDPDGGGRDIGSRGRDIGSRGKGRRRERGRDRRNEDKEIAEKSIRQKYLDLYEEIIIEQKDIDLFKKEIGKDIGAPHLWYPSARLARRRIICHVGPTNSGKTYRALQALTEANSGLYCGPLRLLAWEIYEKLNSNGIQCNLLTGQDKIRLSDAHHIACTVEMADLEQVYDCVVIDEMQLLQDRSRGWAFTRALLGSISKEIHVCGSPEFVPLLKKLMALTNDEVEVLKYERLTPLATGDNLRRYTQLRPGDCIVAFSRKKLYELKKKVESRTKYKSCIVYGSLPPTTRKMQAQLFNESNSGYDILIASDAIGMGLNLSIKRLIFDTTVKFDGQGQRDLHGGEIRQIAGRAGRYFSENGPNGNAKGGEVLSWTNEDREKIEIALQEFSPSITKAGITPTKEQLLYFARVFNFKIIETPEEWKYYNECMAQSQIATFEMEESPEIEFDVDEDGNVIKERTVVKMQNDLKILEEKLPVSTPPVSSSIDGDSATASMKKTTTTLKTLIPMGDLLSLFISQSGIEDNQLYFTCDVEEAQKICELLVNIPLTVHDQYLFMIAPVDVGKNDVLYWHRQFAHQLAERRSVELNINIAQDAKTPETSIELSKLEVIHAIVDNYIWLAIRYDEEIFVDLEQARTCVTTLSNLIQEGLKSITIEKKSITWDDRDIEDRPYNEIEFNSALRTLGVSPKKRRLNLRRLRSHFFRVLNDVRDDSKYKESESSKKEEMNLMKKAFTLIRSQYISYEKQYDANKESFLQAVFPEKEKEEEKEINAYPTSIKSQTSSTITVSPDSPSPSPSLSPSPSIPGMSYPLPDSPLLSTMKSFPVSSFPVPTSPVFNPSDEATAKSAETKGEIDYGVTVKIRGGRIQ